MRRWFPAVCISCLGLISILRGNLVRLCRCVSLGGEFYFKFFCWNRVCLGTSIWTCLVSGWKWILQCNFCQLCGQPTPEITGPAPLFFMILFHICFTNSKHPLLHYFLHFFAFFLINTLRKAKGEYSSAFLLIFK